jgi:8-oxo-dGTP diphosphatase
MARTPIYAAGGVVVRGGGKKRSLIAVVQRSKDERWVLPRGKLKRDEDPMAGARREVVEETGHRVRIHEFLGAITYRARGRPKVVQFWRMQAYERPSRDVMSDIVAVEWLPFDAAVRRLSYPLEKLFLHHAGRRVLKRRRHSTKKKKRARAKTAARRKRKTAGRPRKARTAAHSPHKPARTRRARPRTAKTRAHAPHAHTERRKPRRAASARAAATKQATFSQVATPVHAAPVTPPRAPAKQPTMLSRVLGRFGR